jgi:hypothetical protein
MNVFASESEMQAWISEELDFVDGLGELIHDADWLDSVVPVHIGESSVLKSFRTSYEALHITEILFKNENISLSEPDILKPDFVLYAPETQSVVIVELKNLKSPSRQAGTELSAYSAEIRSYVPFLPDGDIVHVLISQEWPVLLKHYARHEMFWQRRNLLCLRPVRLPNGKPALEILSLQELAEDYSAFQIGPAHLGGYNISLYDDELYSPQADRARLDTALEMFKVALQAMAVAGNGLKSHGFAFLWKDQWSKSLAPYSIVITILAPFKSIERFVRIGEVPTAVEKFIKVISCHDPEGHGNTLEEITDACTDIVGLVCTPRVELFETWGSISEVLGNRMDNIAFAGWGLFGQAALDEVKSRHRIGDLNCSLSSPSVGEAVLSKIIDVKYEAIDLSYYFSDPIEEAE